jgi:hypothetical protein
MDQERLSLDTLFSASFDALESDPVARTTSGGARLPHRYDRRSPT